LKFTLSEYIKKRVKIYQLFIVKYSTIGNIIMTKVIVSAQTLQEETIRPGFLMIGMRHPALDPFMDVTLFSMSQPTFPPHPHAGFSAVTYMLPESKGAFINRDSLGNRNLIEPGAIHWTQAGAGMMHEEIPQSPGVACRGFQMFVKLPASKELLPPAAFHANKDAIPAVSGDGWTARVLAGSLHGVSSALRELAQELVLYDVTVEPHASVELMLDKDIALWAMLMEGVIDVAQANYSAPIGIFWGVDQEAIKCRAGNQGARILIGGGKPLNEPFEFGGPFALSTRERLSDARRRFSSGAMGALKPSF
jgi:redox-sensitive bicupin YhaK (pirin superfamily)